MSSVSINQPKPVKEQTKPNQAKPNQTIPNKQAKKAQMKPGYQIQTLCARVPQTPQWGGGRKDEREEKEKG
jgi:hypothetical protein